MMTQLLRCVIVVIIDNRYGMLFVCHLVRRRLHINEMPDHSFSQCPVLLRNATQVQLVAQYCPSHR